MKEINLGRVIMRKRHERGVTQDELAFAMGQNGRQGSLILILRFFRSWLRFLISAQMS